jgi:hypothetical protein
VPFSWVTDNSSERGKTKVQYLLDDWSSGRHSGRLLGSQQPLEAQVSTESPCKTKPGWHVYATSPCTWYRPSVAGPNKDPCSMLGGETHPSTATATTRIIWTWYCTSFCIFKPSLTQSPLENLLVGELVKKFLVFFFLSQTVHYRVHKSPTPVAILNHMSPAHSTVTYTRIVCLQPVWLGDDVVKEDSSKTGWLTGNPPKLIFSTFSSMRRNALRFSRTENGTVVQMNGTVENMSANSKLIFRAQPLLRQTDFQFLRAISAWNPILNHVDKVNQSLQSENVAVIQASNTVNWIKERSNTKLCEYVTDKYLVYVT